MSRYKVPPPVVRMALRAARDSDEGDLIEIPMQHDVRCDYDLDGEKFAGEMTLHRTFVFHVLKNHEVKFGNVLTAVVSEKIDRTEYRAHQEPCGHPRGCGDPCGWCEEIRRHDTLRTRVGNLLVAAAAGDVELVQKIFEQLGEKDR